MNTFNYLDWLPEEEGKPKKNAGIPHSSKGDLELVERAVQAVEASGTDITGTYATWRDLGFALAQLQEAGRDFFHRISRFHPDYDLKECEEQFDRCLKSNGSGITLGTFFHHVKAAGFDVLRQAQDSLTNGEGVIGSSSKDASTAGMILRQAEEEFLRQLEERQEEEEEEEPEQMPVFPERVYHNLPDFLKRVVAPGATDEEKDLLLLGSLVALSAVLPSFHGFYDGKMLLPNLFLFTVAPASAGKGRLSLIKKILQPIHRELREQSKAMKLQYESELEAYNLSKGEAEKPVKPPEKMLFIPANNSTTGVFQLLHDNDNRGLLFESEGDTLSLALKSEYGNYSDGLRKAWHHETISYYRRTDREYVDIDFPCLSVVLSGTPRQVATLIPNAENGLFSRFLFYYFNLKTEWKDVFERQQGEDLDTTYLQLGHEFAEFYRGLDPQVPIRFHLSRTQREHFNAYFDRIQTKYLSLKPLDYVATVRRMGVVCFRLAMIMTALRGMEEGNHSRVRQCENRDFNTVMAMVSVLLRHSSKVFSSLPEDRKRKVITKRDEAFLEALPKNFCRQNYLEIATTLKIPHKTAERYVYKFVKKNVLQREGFDAYVNLNTE